LDRQDDKKNGSSDNTDQLRTQRASLQQQLDTVNAQIQTDKSQSSDLYRQIDDASLLSALAQLLKS